MVEEKVVLTSCPHDCGGRCVLKVHVRDGVIVRIETDDGEEPQLRACARGRAYRQRVYAPDRLKYPLRRAGERGEGRFERITWEEALDRVVAELKRVKETYGPEAIFYIPYSGNTGTFLHNQLSVYRLLTMFGGFTPHWGSASFWGSLFSSQFTYGTITTGHSRDDLLNSRLIIMWGWNPAETVLITGTSWYLIQAKEKGTKIVAVDPRFTDSAAAFASKWIPIRPGTDTAMLIAMAYVIIKEKLQDEEFLIQYTSGFEQFQDYVLGKEDGLAKTPLWAEKITGVPAVIIEELAKEYATMKPAALMCTGAPGRTAFGEQFHRALSTLSAITGNLGIHGGEPAGFGFQPVGLQPLTGTGLISGLVPGNLPEGTERKRGVHISKVWDAILKGKAGGYPADFKFIYITNGNALNQFPNTNKGVEALKKPDFIVVHEQFLTPTARFADILLPVNTHLERNDIIRPWFSGPWYIYMNKAIDSLYESRSDFEICVELAQRLGIKGYSDKTEDEWLREFWKVSEEMSYSRPLLDYDTLKQKGVHKIFLKESIIAFREQFEDSQPFPTPSGKIEIYSQRLADLNNPEIPPIPKYLEGWEGRNDPLSKKYPLQLITPHFKRRIHSQFENITWLRELEPQEIWINSEDARERGIRHGDLVKVFNDRGIVILPAKVTERIMPGVVSIYQGAWFNPDGEGRDRGGCANVLTKDEHSPAGAFCSNNALVQVEKFS